MKVAVTGATGFVGRHVVRELLSRPGIEVTASSRNAPEASMPMPAGLRHVTLDIAAPTPRDYERLGSPDVLVHLAWSGLPNYRSLHHFESELPAQYAFLRSLVAAGLPSLFVTGTCYEYGMRCGEVGESLEPQPSNPYGFAKDALRRQLEFLRSSARFELTWARLFYTFGPGQAATSLFPQLMAAIDRGDAEFRMSGGEQLRDYLPVGQLASLIADIALKHPGAGIVNICSGQPISVRSLVERLIAERGANIRIRLGEFPYPDYEPLAFWGSRKLLENLLGGPMPRETARQ
jgi:nucleoside-diphosphate-sugar epimerase